jgi:hypothetical protein
MSRYWKAESGAYGIRNQPSPKFLHLLPLKPDRSPVCQSVQKVFSTSSWFQNPVAIKPCIRIGRMSNQRKSEFVGDNFGIQSFGEGHGKNSSKSQCRPKGPVCPEFWFSEPVEFSTVVTHKSLTVWGHIMNHRKSERVSYHNGIRDFRSFGLYVPES